MDKNTEQRERRTHKARERRAKRRERRETMVSLGSESFSKLSDFKPKGIPDPLKQAFSTTLTIAQDTFWHLRHRTGFWKILAGVVVAVVLIFFATLFFSPNIGPNITTMGVNIGGMSVENAAQTLQSAIENDIYIQLQLENQTLASVHPAEIGITLDAETTAQAAKEAGLAGFLFGHEIEPIFEISYSTAQAYMLAIVNDVYIPPYEAGYEWRDGDVVAIPGRASRELDIVQTVQHIVDNAVSIIAQGEIDLVTTSREPGVMDATPYLDDARAFVNSELTIIGYDPFLDEEQQWQTTQEEMANWLVAGVNGITVRDDSLKRFVDGVNNLLNTPENPRFLNENLVHEALRDAIASGETEVQVRVNYLPHDYTVARGETGFSIGRTSGIPFRLISDANPGVDWNQLTVGQEITIPSRDAVLPIEPNSDKRIIVDLDRFYLVAYENDEMVFEWPISIGMPENPTSPGIYQILEKVDVAYGSSFSLCGNSGCGQWQMDYFMGIYEVAPGLTNGFHGAVLLPNGGYLDGGSNQVRSTFGCVMSDNNYAQLLFEWADMGTIVEIISNEFPPESELARQAVAFMDSRT